MVDQILLREKKKKKERKGKKKKREVSGDCIDNKKGVNWFRRKNINLRG